MPEINNLSVGLRTILRGSREPGSQQAAVYMVLRGSCEIGIEDDAGTISTRLLRMGDMLTVSPARRHQISVPQVGSTPSRERPAELLVIQFGVLGEAENEQAPSADIILSASKSRAAAWLWSLAPTLPRSENEATAFCSIAAQRLVEAVLLQAQFDGQLECSKLGSGLILDPDVSKVVELMRSSPAEKWTISALAREVGISRSSLANRFAQTLGRAPMEYLFELRMRHATLLLDRPENEIKQIATAVGYRSIAAFSHAFRRWSGLSPDNFRRSALSAKSAIA